MLALPSTIRTGRLRDKTVSPLGQGRLWDYLIEHYADCLTVEVSVASLQARQAVIGKPWSAARWRAVVWGAGALASPITYAALGGSPISDGLGSATSRRWPGPARPRDLDTTSWERHPGNVDPGRGSP